MEVKKKREWPHTKLHPRKKSWLGARKSSVRGATNGKPTTDRCRGRGSEQERQIGHRGEAGKKKDAAAILGGPGYNKKEKNITDQRHKVT